MDPITALTVAAAVQQFLAAAGKIIQICYRYTQKYRHAIKKIAQLAQELRALVCIFTEVNGMIMGRYNEKLSLQQIGPLIDEAKVDALQILSELPQGQPSRMQALKWPFTEEKTTEIINALSKKLATIQTALQLDHFRISEKSLNYVEALQKSFTALTVKLDYAFEDQTRSKILTWVSFNHLQSLRIQDLHEDKRSTRHPTAGLSSLTNKLFLKWKSDQFYGRDSWLWAIGEAGSRKSIVMSVLADNLLASCSATDTEVAILYCHFEFADPVVEQTLIHILGNLTAQLLRRCSQLPYELVSAYTELVDLGEPPLGVVTDIFISAIRSLGSCYLVVDGLDELNLTVRSGLLEVFGKLDQERVKILISSRPHSLELTGRRKNTNTIEIRPKEVEIATYLRDEIASDDKLQVKISSDPHTSEYLVKEISSRAGQSFTFAVAMLGTLHTGISKRQVIKLVESSKTPNDVFEGTLRRIRQQPEKAEALTILGWLTYARASLTPEQLQIAMAVDVNDGFDNRAIPAKEIILEICGGLVQIQPSSGIIGLTHLTARDYLIKQPELNSIKVERMLAQVCIRYLLSPEFAKPCVSRDELAHRQIRSCFTTYAASFWPFHASAAQETGLTDLILEFALQPYASSALQLLPVDVSESFAGPASPMEYRLGLCQELIPASYLCAQFKLSKSQAALFELESDLTGQSVTWGHQYAPLHLSIWLEDIETAKVLLQLKINIVQKDRFGLTPAHLAASLSNRSTDRTCDILDLILEADTDFTIRDWGDQDGHTALHLAAKSESKSAIRALLEKGYSPNALDNHKSTPLHLYMSSVSTSQTFPTSNEIPLLMLAHGADPTQQDDQGKSLLSMAVQIDRTDLVVIFRETLNPNTGQPYEFSPDDIELSNLIYQKILDKRVAKHAVHEKHRAQAQNEKRLAGALERLLRRNMNSPTREHLDSNIVSMPFSALSYAARKGGSDTVIRLLAGQGNINARDESGNTALHYAVEMGRENVVWVLLCRGADPEIANDMGIRPAQLALRSGTRQVHMISRALDMACRLKHNTTSLFSDEDAHMRWVARELFTAAERYDVLSHEVRRNQYHVLSTDEAARRIIREFDCEQGKR